MNFSKIVLFLLVALQLQQTALACRAFGYGSNGQRFTAKSFDFDLGHGRAFVNLRGKEKKSFLLKPASRLSWTSKYGNVTFGQLGPEFPFGGMNEKGLTAEVLWLTETEEKKDNGPSINEAQYVQYILDMAQDIDDVVESLPFREQLLLFIILSVIKVQDVSPLNKSKVRQSTDTCRIKLSSLKT